MQTQGVPEHVKKWIVVYPLYLDGSKSIAEGRRVPKNLAVETPRAEEIGLVCKFLQLEHVVEDKRHPADFFVEGRVRVCLFKDDGSPVREDVPTKKALLRILGEKVPQLKNRGKTAATAEEKPAKSGGGQKKGSQPTTKKPTTNNKKKGRK